jgi:hypothetical protein
VGSKEPPDLRKPFSSIGGLAILANARRAGPSSIKVGWSKIYIKNVNSH